MYYDALCEPPPHPGQRTESNAEIPLKENQLKATRVIWQSARNATNGKEGQASMASPGILRFCSGNRHSTELVSGDKGNAVQLLSIRVCEQRLTRADPRFIDLVLVIDRATPITHTMSAMLLSLTILSNSDYMLPPSIGAVHIALDGRSRRRRSLFPLLQGQVQPSRALGRRGLGRVDPDTHTPRWKQVGRWAPKDIRGWISLPEQIVCQLGGPCRTKMETHSSCSDSRGIPRAHGSANSARKSGYSEDPIRLIFADLSRMVGMCRSWQLIMRDGNLFYIHWVQCSLNIRDCTHRSALEYDTYGRESIFISLLSTLPTGDFSTLSEVGSQILFASDKKNFRDDEEDKALRAACTQLAEFMALFDEEDGYLIDNEDRKLQCSQHTELEDFPKPVSVGAGRLPRELYIYTMRTVLLRARETDSTF
ncbi:hypothetical protein M747DRAFT_313256 [Aspergillus niger ATCC 13496]|uniref:Contig An02c0410, genomic contig n=3 Tax=Aspergillus niger TaxID=5061 RepID=A2QEZ3_ASPNC|nr:uncharacterized protein An02g12730 [Aspergillus niger]RDH23255.1 hypothetical protein M747DRAFT_313256 [Aspergillus niger ATCC 13496]CAK44543.1 unnamed protein product [Aspergillus niger]